MNWDFKGEVRPTLEYVQGGLDTAQRRRAVDKVYGRVALQKGLAWTPETHNTINNITRHTTQACEQYYNTPYTQVCE